MLDLNLKVKIKNNKTGEEKTESTVIHLETFIQNSLDYNQFRIGDVFLQGLFKFAMKSLNINLCNSDEAQLLNNLRIIDIHINTLASDIKLHKVEDINYNFSDYTFTICEETFETINNIIIQYNLKRNILTLNKNADKVTELVNHLDYNSKGKSYNITCELESVNFLLERILKEYDTETK